jgi:HlyD family secretion protein
MTKPPKYLIVLLLVILIGAAIWFTAGRPSPGNSATDLRLAEVQPRDFQIRINSIGALDAERSYMVSSTIKGDKGKIIFLVEEGNAVQSGDVLVRFDPTPFENDISRLNGELKSREAVVEAHQQLLDWEKSQHEGNVKSAEYAIKEASQEVQRYQSYIRDLEELRKKGQQFPTEIDQARKKSDQLQAKQEKARGDYEQAKKDAVYKIASAMANLNKVKSEQEATRFALAEAQSELAKTEIRAKMPGMPVHFEQFRDNQKRKPRVGDIVWQNQPILYLPDVSTMLVKTQVREIDLHRLQKGQKAQVRLDAYPETPFTGDVVTIGILASDGADGAKGEKFFQLTLRLNERDARLRPGMTARVGIVAEEVKGALAVPLQAIFEENGRSVCYVGERGKYRVQQVKTERQNEDWAEVTSGVTRGTQVSMVKPPRETVR